MNDYKEIISKSTLREMDKKNWVLVLPEQQIPDWDELKLRMTKIMGKYKKVKNESTFVFTINPTPYLELIKEGHSPDIKKEHQFYGTPKEVAFKMFDMCAHLFRPFVKILEPSAGKGGLVRALSEWHLSNYFPSQYLSYQIHLIEQFAANRFFLKELSDKYMKMGMPLFLPEQCTDFMQMDLKNKYDLIIANPPFAKGQAIAHLKKMCLHLRVGNSASLEAKSAIVVVLPEAIKTDKDFLEIQKRFWTKIEDLPKNSFKASGTAVNCFICGISCTPFPDNFQAPKGYLKMEGDKIREVYKDGTPFPRLKLTDDILECFYLEGIEMEESELEVEKEWEPKFRDYKAKEKGQLALF